MAGPQQRLVVGQLPAGAQHGAEALDRHVRQGEELVEDDAEVGGEHPPVVGLQLGLGWGQHRPLGVVDEVQRQPRLRLAVAEGVEPLQPGDAAGEHAIAALAIDVGRQIAGQ